MITGNCSGGMSDRIIDLIIELKKKCTLKEEEIRKEFSLAQAEYRGVVAMERDEKITCSEFSRRLELSSSRGSRIIEKMIEKKFLNYDSIPGDRRAHLVSLTGRGHQVKNKIEQKKDECEKSIRDHYTGRQVDDLKTGLAMLLEAM